jgi:hypothetical protein
MIDPILPPQATRASAHYARWPLAHSADEPLRGTETTAGLTRTGASFAEPA